MSLLRLVYAKGPWRGIAILALVAALAPSVPAEAAPGGDVVATLEPRLPVVFQARDGAHWFGSNGRGVYRVEGKKIVRYGKEHGLAGDHVVGIQEDAAGNVHVGADGGVSRFDGRTFRALALADPARSAWALGPDDLWFPAGQDTGSVFRCDGKEVHRLALPKTERGEAFVARHPRSQYPNIKYSPYDVYVTFKDSRRHVWFGTANLGACGYDGASFLWIAETEFGFAEHHSFGTRSIVEDKDGKLWFSKTLSRFAVESTSSGPRPEGGAVPSTYRKEPGVGREADPFSTFVAAVKDQNGDLWLATLGAGVWRYDDARMTGYPVQRDNTNIWLSSIYRDRQDVLWVGTNEHGVYRFSGKAFEPFKP